MGFVRRLARLISISALLAGCLLAVAATAAVAAPAAQTKALPEVIGTSPNPRDPKGSNTWTGDQVTVNFTSHGAKLDLAACKLYINTVEQTLSTPAKMLPAVSRADTSGVKFEWDDAYGKGQYSFRAVLVTTTGEKVEYSWNYDSGGSRGGSLISVAVMRDYFWFIARGAVVTVELTLVSIVFACIFALVGSLGRLSRTTSFGDAWRRHRSVGYMVRLTIGRIPYWLATFYTSLFRGTPLLVQIWIIYAGIPEVLQYFGLPESYNPSVFVSGVAALSLNYGAYLTEVFRAGVQAVPKGQHEAAWALGLSGWQTQRRIILPQALRIVTPAVGNDFIALIKDTSLVSVIGVQDLLRRAYLAGAATFSFISTLLVAAAFYWVLTIFFSFWQAKLETSMARDKRRERRDRMGPVVGDQNGESGGFVDQTSKGRP